MGDSNCGAVAPGKGGIRGPVMAIYVGDVLRTGMRSARNGCGSGAGVPVPQFGSCWAKVVSWYGGGFTVATVLSGMIGRKASLFGGTCVSRPNRSLTMAAMAM